MTRDTDLRGKTAIVGVAESDLGEVAPGVTAFDIMAQATHRALDDCGLQLSDIDAVFTCNSLYRTASLNLSEYLGIYPRYSDSSQIGGASFIAHLNHAQAAIAAGLCDVALVAYGAVQRATGRANASPREFIWQETPYKAMSPASSYALAAARHMHQYGTTRRHLAEVAVAARQWALLNPVAWEKKPLTIEEALAARMVTEPFTVRDCCLVNDGGGALIVTSAARARDLKKPPVYVLGAGEAISHRNISSMADLTTTLATQSGADAFRRSGYGPQDMDMAMIYDAFTINPILILEDLGFCKKGEGGPFISNGRIAPGGDFPMNTNGGGLSYCHPGMYGLLLTIEGVRQIRGEADRRQVADCNVALLHGVGGVFSTQCTAVIGSAATL
jgi:acetyl-CoA acetyltransferase